jgi:AcrR family transcriptional regulator
MGEHECSRNEAMPRKYEMRRRADRQAETRDRIIEATVALHEQLGPSRTTISAIADLAGVERLTVYRHFPDDRALLSACTSHFAATHPLPDFVPWEQIPDPPERLRTGLADIYDYYGRTERMMVATSRDLAENDMLIEVLAPHFRHWQRVQEVLAAGWDRGEVRIVRAAIGHATSFETWYSLVRQQGLDDDEAIALMVKLVASSQDEFVQRYDEQNDRDLVPPIAGPRGSR